MNQLPYNHMSFRDRLQSSSRLLARARKQGYGQMWRLWLTEQPTLCLGSPTRLDGLSLYRQALSKVEISPVIYKHPGKTILLVSHCQ